MRMLTANSQWAMMMHSWQLDMRHRLQGESSRQLMVASDDWAWRCTSYEAMLNFSLEAHALAMFKGVCWAFIGKIGQLSIKNPNQVDFTVNWSSFPINVQQFHENIGMVWALLCNMVSRAATRLIHDWGSNETPPMTFSTVCGEVHL